MYSGTKSLVVMGKGGKGGENRKNEEMRGKSGESLH